MNGGGFAVCAAGLRRRRLYVYGDNSEIARKSADADEWHHNFCSVVPVRSEGCNGVNERKLVDGPNPRPRVTDIWLGGLPIHDGDVRRVTCF